MPGRGGTGTKSDAKNSKGARSKSELDILHQAMMRAENKVGGGEGLVGIYGSMTQQGTCNIMQAMAEHTGLGKDSVFVDIGSGLCRPLLHAALELKVKRTIGVELDAVKCQKAVPFIKHTLTQLETEGVQFSQEAVPKVVCLSAEQLGSLHPATHAYAAWEGFPRTAMEAIGKLFASTPSIKAITIVQRSMRNKDPAEEMAELGFGEVECCAPAIPVYMGGSGRQLNAYVFKKKEGSSRGAGSRGQQQAGPSLESAPAFDPAAVLEALQRMDDGRGVQSTGQGCTAGASRKAGGRLRSDGGSDGAGSSRAQQQAGRKRGRGSNSSPGQAGGDEEDEASGASDLTSAGLGGMEGRQAASRYGLRRARRVCVYDG